MTTKLTPHQRRFVQAHREGKSKFHAAKQAQVKIAKANEYLRLEVVQEALQTASDDELASLTAAAIGKLHTVFDVMEEIITDRNVYASNRIGAARVLLQAALDLRQVKQLEDRIAELEDMRLQNLHEVRVLRKLDSQLG